jgi:hypothetical protein
VHLGGILLRGGCFVGGLWEGKGYQVATRADGGNVVGKMEDVAKRKMKRK